MALWLPLMLQQVNFPCPCLPLYPSPPAAHVRARVLARAHVLARARAHTLQ